MNDYSVKRRYRQRKLTRQGYYELRHQRSRARRRAAMNAATGTLPSIEQIFHPENLVRVFDDLQHHAGHAAGLDGVSYDQLGRRETGQIMRQLSTEILDGTYEPSRARHVRIAKASGRGHRTLSLRSILYRVVAKALADALGPYFDQMFLDGSHGFRPDRGPGTMLVAMEQIILKQERFVIAQDDIANAFDNVQIDYALELYRQYINDEALLVLINKILRGHRTEHRTTGIDQGSALSPLTLNVVLHHALDVPFSENAAHPPWLRYADDLCYLCQSVHEGQTAIQTAQNLLDPVGMALKGTDGPPADLTQGHKATILGLSIHGDTGQIRYDLTEGAWTSLKQKLSETHMTHTSPDTAIQVIKGWVEACGPAFEGKMEKLLSRIRKVAAEVGHRELSQRRLKQDLQSSRDRWVSRRRRAHRASKEIRDRERAEAPLTADPPGISTCPRPGSPQDEPAAVSAPILHGEVGR